ncbi:alpha-E domain-containing protein [Thalassococcus lentus]|uniref:Alpha-E domain-containing protein n=1 Tax=Thalassococcus lentus TaxID=1210524 RepID=A0ABT4XUI8_9RHOB|nr:alpha-E domain-containing protein [Thalassococcus lentus]MDA7425621.1 alpha-E domain-containing protein [Thalassococcus lentus]
MLGKTANGLFWMSRYLERAENTARLIETGQRIALTRLGSGEAEWIPVLQSAGSLDGFHDAYETPGQEAAVDWMLRGRDNPSSIMACIASARQNARLVRTAITGEVWEAVNATYMMARELLARKVSERDLPAVLAAIRQNTALVRGMIHGTMLRNDIYDFLRIGTFLERADNTARILDVKYYVLLPSVSAIGSSIDNVQWESILRSVSARGGFRMEYGSEGGPQEIAHFLIFDKRMPRSLAFCVGKIKDNLRYLNASQSKPSQSQKLVTHLETAYLSHGIDQVFEYGLHEFIEKMLELLGDLAGQIQLDYRFYE